MGQCQPVRHGFRVCGGMHHSRSHISSRPRLSWPRLLPSRKSFTPEEVRRRLQVDDMAHDERTQAVHVAAARTGVWSGQLPDRLAFELGRSAHRLPSVVYWYRQGLSPRDIGRRLSPFGSDWDANRALDAAASLIAQSLNRGEIEGI
jgi:hypothetical protein